MLVFRSLTFGLLGACVAMLFILVARGEPQWCPTPRPPAPAAAVANPVTIIDLARATDGAWQIRDLADMIRLAPGEEIVAVDDQPVVEGLPMTATADRFADFTVASATTNRRVLVLIH